VEHVPLEEIAADATFRVRAPGDVAELAVSMGRLGQLDPVDLRPLPAASAEAPARRWQVVAGFRRMEALRLLQREKVLARVHPSLADGDAWALALAGPLFGEPLTVADLDAIAVRVRAFLPWAEPILAADNVPVVAAEFAVDSVGSAEELELSADTAQLGRLASLSGGVR
jgi:ParB-like chromosome segregation protein Spo0J